MLPYQLHQKLRAAQQQGITSSSSLSVLRDAIVRFDPSQQKFEVFSLPSPGAEVRQLLGRGGEVWGAESATDKLVVIRNNNSTIFLK